MVTPMFRLLPSSLPYYKDTSSKHVVAWDHLLEHILYDNQTLSTYTQPSSLQQIPAGALCARTPPPFLRC